MADKRSNGMQSPKYVIPASAFGIVAYPEKRAVGFQFQDPWGNHTFVALPGQSIRLLLDDMEELVREMPEIEEWELPSVPGAIIQ